jgi:HTH-type transcriptional regulator/antitoxin HigA
MDIRPIRTDEDHRAALAAIDACWGAPEGTEEGDKLDVLLARVDIYESKRWRVKIETHSILSTRSYSGGASFGA